MYYGYGFGFNYKGGGVSVDPDAQAFITAASITDPTQQSAVNQLVVDLKAANLWTKMKAVYPFVGGSASTHKWNLKDPRDLDAAFRLTFNGGITHSLTGIKFGGTNGIAETHLVPSSTLNQNSTHLSIYSRSNVAGGIEIEMGTNNIHNCYLLYTYSGTNYKAINSTTQDTTPPNLTGTTNLFIGTRTASNVVKYFKSNVNTHSISTSSTGLSATQIYIGNYANVPNGSYSSKEFAFASIGDGLSDTDAANLYTAVQAFQTTLSRNV